MTTNPTRTESELTTRDGLRLYFVCDELPDPRAAVLLLHGFGEHCRRYDGVVRRLNGAGVSVYRIDVRGHGRSGGPRGHVYRWEEYLADADALRAEGARRAPDVPHFLLGHSNGGLIAFHSAVRQPEGLRGLVLSSPFFGFQIKVPAVKAVAGRVLSRFAPAFGLATGLDPATLSHDAAVVEAYASDPLNVRVATGRWLTESIGAHEDALVRARDLQLPLLLQQAGDDLIASLPASRSIYDRVGSQDRTWRAYPGLFHEIYFELENEAPLADLEGWLRDRMSAPVA